jgi:hypothetical protein
MHLAWRWFRRGFNPTHRTGASVTCSIAHSHAIVGLANSAIVKQTRRTEDLRSARTDVAAIRLSKIAVKPELCGAVYDRAKQASAASTP